jgi:hypothetical protein
MTARLRTLAAGNFRAVSLLLFLAAPAAAQNVTAAMQPMAKDAHPAFEVATIKPSDSNSTGSSGFHLDGRHVSCKKTTVGTILSVAHGIHVKQIACRKRRR